MTLSVIMDLALLGIPIGIIFLYFGSKWMVDGAKMIAIIMGISPFVIGLTVLAFGSSAPEAFTSIVSRDAPQLIIGNVVGSNIVNLGVAIGLAAILSPLFCSFKETKLELGFMVLSGLMVYAMALTGMIGLGFGLILVASIFIFVYIVYRLKRNGDGAKAANDEKETVDWPLWKCILLTVFGLAVLYFGSEFFVAGAKVAAGMLGVSDLLIGLIVVAVGTSLPEICICLMAAYRGETDMAISNIVGSNIFNCFFVLGIGACLADVPILDSVLTFHLPVMMVMTLIMCAFLYKNDRIGRYAGAILFAIYVVYVALLAFNPSLTM